VAVVTFALPTSERVSLINKQHTVYVTVTA
jgi:hypothetical protein